jgi:amino acid permease
VNYVAIIVALLAAAVFSVAAFDVWVYGHAPFMSGVLSGLAVMAFVVMGVAVNNQTNDNRRDADRKVEECIAAGGTPDVYGRNGTRVRCYLP